jgi:anti-sigma B factor antagonist
MQRSTVLAGQFDHVVWVKVEGRGTFQVSAGMKEFTRRMIQRGFREFVIDLAECELMDSTFMGTMAGMALRLREMGSGRITLLHANTRNLSLLENLGLNHLFEDTLPAEMPSIIPPAEVDLNPTQAAPATANAQRTAMIAAHEALIAAEPANENRFKDVIELLKQDPAQDSADS